MATIEQIKKKMQAMKTEKENATDLADQAEEKTKLAQQKQFIQFINLFLSMPKKSSSVPNFPDSYQFTVVKLFSELCIH